MELYLLSVGATIHAVFGVFAIVIGCVTFFSIGFLLLSIANLEVPTESFYTFIKRLICVFGIFMIGWIITPSKDFYIDFLEERGPCHDQNN